MMRELVSVPPVAGLVGAVLFLAACGGGGPTAEKRISAYVGKKVENCSATGMVKVGLPVYNCGFQGGGEGCYSVDPHASDFEAVTEYYGGANCPDSPQSVKTPADQGWTQEDAASILWAHLPDSSPIPTCYGDGTGTGGRFSHFWCTIKLRGNLLLKQEIRFKATGLSLGESYCQTSDQFLKVRCPDHQGGR